MSRTSSLRVVAVQLYNPLPAKVSEVDVIKKAGFFDNKARENVPAFRVNYTWGGSGVGPDGSYEYDEVILDPGDVFETNERDADVILKTLGELGIVKLTKNQSLQKAALAGLHTALRYYRAAGEEYILKFQQGLNLTDEQLRLKRNTLKSYYINMEKAKLIENEIKQLYGQE